MAGHGLRAGFHHPPVSNLVYFIFNLKYSAVMTKYPLALHTLYAELIEQCRISEQTPAAWPLSGTLVKAHREGGEHWYYQASRRYSPDGKQMRTYIGPASQALDEQTREAVETFHREKQAWKEREKMVRALGQLVRTPTKMVADLVLGLYEFGVLAKCILVGTVAFQGYSPLLGYSFGPEAYHTSDLDLVQAKSIAMVPISSGKTLPLGDILKKIDSRFEPIWPISRKGKPSKYRIADNDLRVDVLAPARGSATSGTTPAAALATSASRVQFLDFLVDADPIRIPLLIGGGVMANVPEPSRYAVHKLIVAMNRSGIEQVKIRKDLAQAGTLLRLLLTDQPESLGDVLREGLARGPGWRQRIMRGLEALKDNEIKKKALELAAEPPEG